MLSGMSINGPVPVTGSWTDRSREPYEHCEYRLLFEREFGLFTLGQVRQ